MDASRDMHGWRRLFEPGAHWGWVGWAAAVLFAWLWFYIATALIAQVNGNRLQSDQQNNIELARESGWDAWPKRTDGVVNPLWPWIAARFASDTDLVFFTRGKWVNVALAGIALLSAARCLRRKLSPIALASAVVLAGLGCLLPHAVYFQPEPLFYMLFTGLVAIGCWLMFRNPLWGYAAFGALAGIAYLAKASVTPFAVVFAGATFLRVICGWIWRNETGQWKAWRCAVGLLLAVAVSAVVTLPRAMYSKQRFGSPYHAYPKYWMWHDDFGAESVPFMARHPDAASLNALGKADRPSFRGYLERHGWAGVRERLTHGTWEKTWRFYLPERHFGNNVKSGRWKTILSARGFYFIGLAAMAAAMAVVGARFQKGSAVWLVPVVALGCGMYVIYSLAYGWYDPIGRGDRFMMTLFLPLTAGLFAFVDQLRRGIAMGSFAWKVYASGQACIAACLLWRVVRVVASPLFLA